MTSVATSSTSGNFNAPNTRVMVEMASEELFIQGWDGLDETVFQLSNVDNQVLMNWEACTFAQEDFAAIQQLVLEKLSETTADRLVRTDEKRLEGRVRVRSSSNDDDDCDALDHQELDRVSTIVQQFSKHSLATNASQTT